MNLPGDEENVLGDLSSRQGEHGRHWSDVLLGFPAIPTRAGLQQLRALRQVPAAEALRGSLAVGRCLMTFSKSHTTAKSEQTRSAGLVMKSVLFPEAVLSMSFFSVRTPEFSLWKQTPRPGEGMLSVGTVPSQRPALLECPIPGAPCSRSPLFRMF